jgi:hypothetical protein
LLRFDTASTPATTMPMFAPTTADDYACPEIHKAPLDN